MSASALFIYSFPAHLLTKGNIHSISKVMRQMHERSEQAHLKILRLGMVTHIIVCLPNVLFSFFLTSRILIYFRTARCPAKEKKNQHSLVSYTTRNGHITVPPSDMNETVVKWSSSWQTEEHEFYPSPSSCLECRGSARRRAATVR